MFASCFGFQMLVQAWVARLSTILRPPKWARFDMELTDAGEADELTGVLPKVFRSSTRAQGLAPSFCLLV